MLLTINAQQTADHRRALGKMNAAMKDAGVRVLRRQEAQLLDGAREHFGFADGFAQPAIAGATDDKLRGGGIPEKHGGWRALAPGEFILGYPDEDTLVDRLKRLPPAPADPLGAAARTWSGASCIRTSRCGGARSGARPRATRAARRSSPRRSSGAGTTGRRS